MIIALLLRSCFEGICWLADRSSSRTKIPVLILQVEKHLKEFEETNLHWISNFTTRTMSNRTPPPPVHTTSHHL